MRHAKTIVPKPAPVRVQPDGSDAPMNVETLLEVVEFWMSNDLDRHLNTPLEKNLRYRLDEVRKTRAQMTKHLNGLHERPGANT